MIQTLPKRYQAVSLLFKTGYFSVSFSLLQPTAHFVCTSYSPLSIIGKAPPRLANDCTLSLSERPLFIVDSAIMRFSVSQSLALALSIGSSFSFAQELGFEGVGADSFSASLFFALEQTSGPLSSRC